MNIIADTSDTGKRTASQQAGAVPASPMARFMQATLPTRTKMLHEYEDGVLLATYDPSQINALDARLLSNIYVDFTEGEQVDGLRELGRDAIGDAASSKLFAAVLDYVDRSGDAPGVIARVVELFGQVCGNTQTLCPHYSWCVETGSHVEHTSDSVEPAFLEADRRELLAAGLTHWSKGIRVGFLEQDLTPADARTKLAELRAHLDAVEKLIDTADEAQ
ncbi:hypothetical protein ACH4M4_36065 [Streptomyces sp. NPDC017254]|uniref:hypothetical protein n=1 Tax=unclassified Streptomyces TaxID=2593676 RepID=UPI003796A733